MKITLHNQHIIHTLAFSNVVYTPRPRRLTIVGFGCKEGADRDLFEDMALGLRSTALRDNGRAVATLQRLPPQLLRQVMTPWVSPPDRPAKRWRSVTPIVLSGFTRRGRSREQCIPRALIQQGSSLDDVETGARPSLAGRLPGREFGKLAPGPARRRQLQPAVRPRRCALRPMEGALPSWPAR